MVAAFFKISCPVCQYTFPFLERIYKAHGGKNVTIVGISQNERKDTAAFNKEYGVTFPVLLDDTDTYPASNAYGLTNVPTIFWIGQDGEIEISSVGWERKEIEEINRKAAELNGGGQKPVFRAASRFLNSAPVEGRRTSPRSRAPAHGSRREFLREPKG